MWKTSAMACLSFCQPLKWKSVMIFPEKLPWTSRCYSLLTAELQHYFPDSTSCSYITDPFSVDPDNLPVGTREQEELIDVQEDQTAKKQRKECSAINFWLSMASSYPTLASHAVPQLLIFPSTWECEKGFSILMNIKSKNRSWQSAPGHDFRLLLVKLCHASINW